MQSTQTVIEGNCLDLMRKMAAGNVVAIVTSPPYNLGKAYRSYNDDRPLEEYLAEQGRVAEQVARVLKPDGHLFLNVGWNSKHAQRSMQVMLEYNRHLMLQQPIRVALYATTLPQPLQPFDTLSDDASRRAKHRP